MYNRTSFINETDYAGLAQLCARSPIMRAHNRIIQRSLPSVLWHCWLGGRKGIRPVKKLEWWGAGVVICLGRGADPYDPADATATHCLLLSVKSRLDLPFWYWLTRVVLDKGPLNGCVCCHDCTSGGFYWKYGQFGFLPVKDDRINRSTRLCEIFWPQNVYCLAGFL